MCIYIYIWINTLFYTISLPYLHLDIFTQTWSNCQPSRSPRSIAARCDVARVRWSLDENAGIWGVTMDLYRWINVAKHPGGLFIEPAFSTLQCSSLISFHKSQWFCISLKSSISLKSTRVLFTGYVKHLSGTLFFSALSVLHNFCSELGEVFVGTVFPSPLPSTYTSVASYMWGSARRRRLA